jgi:hypothetical protein
MLTIFKWNLYFSPKNINNFKLSLTLCKQYFGYGVKTCTCIITVNQQRMTTPLNKPPTTTGNKLLVIIIRSYYKLSFSWKYSSKFNSPGRKIWLDWICVVLYDLFIVTAAMLDDWRDHQGWFMSSLVKISPVVLQEWISYQDDWHYKWTLSDIYTNN